MMATFFYSRTDSQCLKTRYESIAGKPDVYWLDEPMCSTRGQVLDEMMDRVGAGDTLIVARLGDLGAEAGEINEMIKLLQSRLAHVVVLELDEIDLALSDNRIACRMLDAIARLECHHGGRKHVSRTAGAHHRIDEEILPEAVVTQYSLGESIASLARRYNVPRSRIERIVRPRRVTEPVLTPGFGD